MKLSLLVTFFGNFFRKTQIEYAKPSCYTTLKIKKSFYEEFR